MTPPLFRRDGGRIILNVVAARSIAVAIAVALLLLFMGAVISNAGYSTLKLWEGIGPLYAACGVAWIVAGPVMIVAALWILASLGRQKLPQAIGGATAFLAGTVLLVGVLTSVIPCSGPS